MTSELTKNSMDNASATACSPEPAVHTYEVYQLRQEWPVFERHQQQRDNEKLITMQKKSVIGLDHQPDLPNPDPK